MELEQKMTHGFSNRSAAHLQPVRDEQGDGPPNFDLLFDRFANYVASVALRLLGDESVVDDIVQDVFLDCFKKIDTLHNMEHARRWLVRVTVRKAGRKLRQNKIVRLFKSSYGDNFREPAISTVTADERAELVMLYRMLEQLSVKVRLAWCLRYLEGAELSEVAFACGCSLATAKRRIRTAQQFILGYDHD